MSEAGRRRGGGPGQRFRTGWVATGAARPGRHGGLPVGVAGGAAAMPAGPDVSRREAVAHGTAV
ncbi:MAG: hypothetical protein ABSC73_00315 [Acidimicrobiales bacterium]